MLFSFYSNTVSREMLHEFSCHETALLYIITQLYENWASLWICILFYAILTGNGGSIGILF